MKGKKEKNGEMCVVPKVWKKSPKEDQIFETNKKFFSVLRADGHPHFWVVSERA
jgi:hypothetical protein